MNNQALILSKEFMSFLESSKNVSMSVDYRFLFFCYFFNFLKIFFLLILELAKIVKIQTKSTKK
jgi:hypothetical protein